MMKNYKNLYTQLVEQQAKLLWDKNEPSHAYFNEQLTLKDLTSEFEDTEIAKDIVTTYKLWVELEK